MEESCKITCSRDFKAIRQISKTSRDEQSSQVNVQMSVVVQLLSHVQLFETSWTVACQALLSMEFPRQEYWNGLPFPPPGDLPNLGIKPTSHVSCVRRQVLYHQHHLGSPHIRLLTCQNSTQASLIQRCQEREDSVPKGKQQMSAHPKQGCFEHMHKTTVLYFSTSNWLLPQNKQELNHGPRFLSNFNVYCRFFFSH